MLTADMFTGFADSLTADVLVVIPVALGVMATLWGLRLAIKYFKGIAR
jgi:hypothetical protein